MVIRMADIFFRTDGNSEIATGHLTRCLAVARACARRGANTAFVVSDRESESMLRERFSWPEEFTVHCLNSDYQNPQEELPSLFSLALSGNADRAKGTNADQATETGTDRAAETDTDRATETGADRAKEADAGRVTEARASKPWMFVDSYYATPTYLHALGTHFRVAYLDDLRSFDCPVDLVVNYDTDQDCGFYAAAKRRLLGAQYTPLREQFEGASYTVRPAVEHVLLSTGGTDPYGVAEQLLRAVYSSVPSPLPSGSEAAGTLQSVHYHILTSRANTRYDALEAFAQTHPLVHICEGVSEVAALMASCDLAVCAGGATLCELCAVGVPTVSYLMAENQRTAVETYDRLGLIPCVGDIRPARPQADAVRASATDTTDPSVSFSPEAFPASPSAAPASPDALPPINPGVLSRVLSFMTYMSQNYPARKKSSQSMRAFLDNAGAGQIAAALFP